MTKATRARYLLQLWPAACAAQGWPVRDESRRHQVTADCMRAIKAPVVTSTSDLGPDEITALFCYLEFLANPAGLDTSARWLDCQQDYHAYNRARQADWYERKTYGKGRNKLDRDRFSGETSAQGKPLDDFDPEAIQRRFITVASRAQKRERQARKEAHAHQEAEHFPF